MEDNYKILGLESNATIADVKKAYRRLAKTYHPDINKEDGNAEVKFKIVADAYEAVIRYLDPTIETVDFEIPTYTDPVTGEEKDLFPPEAIEDLSNLLKHAAFFIEHMDEILAIELPEEVLRNIKTNYEYDYEDEDEDEDQDEEDYMSSFSSYSIGETYTDKVLKLKIEKFLENKKKEVIFDNRMLLE